MLEIYLTGIKQNSGTTLIMGGIAATMQGLGYSTAVYVPVQMNAKIKNGFIQAPDTMFAKFMDKNITTYCSYLYKSKYLTPDVFEKERLYMDKNVIFQDYMNVVNNYECVVISGLSDLTANIETNFTEEELMRTSNSPIVLVASLKNSDENEIIDYLNFVKLKNLNVRGIIINRCPMEILSTEAKIIQKNIEQNTNIPVLGIIPEILTLGQMKPEDWIEYIICRTDLEAIFNIQISRLHAAV